jgi:hypothetical protein
MRQSQHLTVIAATLITVALSSFASAGIVATMNPVADTFVASAQPNNNYGSGGALSAAASELPQGEFQSLIRFNASSAKSAFDAAYGAEQWTIQSVSLQLTAAAPNNVIFNASAAGQFSIDWMQNDSWVEGTGTPGSPSSTGLTFTSLPLFLSGADESLGTFAFGGGTSGSATYSLGLTTGFESDLEAGSLVGMRLFASDSTVSYLFNSRNFGVISNRPLLAITAIPEPSNFLLSTIAILIITGAPLRNQRGAERREPRR